MHSNLHPGSSPAPDETKAAPQDESPDGGPSGSSENPGETEASLLSVLRDVAATPVDATANSEAPGSPPEGQEKGNDAEVDADKGDYSDVPFNDHPRFRELVAQKNDFMTKLAEVEPDAEQYRQIQTFMDKSNLSPEEVAEGLFLMAEMKSGDPAKAYEALSKKLETLALACGKKLPAEIEERVEQGYVDRETAEQLYGQQLQALTIAQRAQQALQHRDRADAKQQALAVSSAVQTWESTTRASDPDYPIKAELVKDRLRAHIATNGMPTTPAEAVKLSKDAYDSVTETLMRVRGPKHAMRPTVGGKVNGSATPEPRNLLDVIRQATGAGMS